MKWSTRRSGLTRTTSWRGRASRAECISSYPTLSSDYPIVSTRDESHADEMYFRVRVVNGEGTRSEYTTLLKHSFTTYVLLAIQDGHIKDIPEIADPIAQGQEIAKNLNGDWSVKLTDGGRIGVTDYLNAHYMEGVEKLSDTRIRPPPESLRLQS
ncbi:hypothetical protein GH157_02825, partial [archaeon]|nr:hypothetical protein [archaeon]